MKKVAWLFISLLSLCACHHNDDPAPFKNQPVDMTVMAYFVADNNLEDYLKQNVTMMCQGLQQLRVPAALLVYWDGKAGGVSDKYWPEPCILKYVTDGKGRLNGKAVNLPTSSSAFRPGHYTHTDTLAWAAAEVIPTTYTRSTDKDEMAGVIKQMVQLSPSAHYGLIAGSHGSGWLEYITGKNATARSFGQDGSLDNTISTGDMAWAVSAAGKTMDFVLFDACLMACAEVCYEFRNVADYLIASVVDIPGPGFPYSEMLPLLYEHKAEAYEEACRAYIDYYTALKPQGYWGTMSLIDCSEVDALTAAVRSQLEAHAADLANYNPLHLQRYGLNPYAPNFNYVSFDLRQFIEDINGGTCPDDFRHQLEKTVPYAGYVANTSNYRIDGDHYCGLGMYVPVESKNYWNIYFKTLAWYSAAGWNKVRP